MPGLSVTEKTHWKDRIARRIDKRIEALHAEDPHFTDRMQREARDRALQSLGLAELQAELVQTEQGEAVFEQRKTAIRRAMLARIRGVSGEEVDDTPGYAASQEVTAAIQRRQAVHTDELFAAHDLGRRILQLREEKDNLLDTVWLATSPAQIKTLWSKVADLLGDPQTQLQRDALAIAPLEAT